MHLFLLLSVAKIDVCVPGKPVTLFLIVRELHSPSLKEITESDTLMSAAVVRLRQTFLGNF